MADAGDQHEPDAGQAERDHDEATEHGDQQQEDVWSHAEYYGPVVARFPARTGVRCSVQLRM